MATFKESWSQSRWVECIETVWSHLEHIFHETSRNCGSSVCKFPSGMLMQLWFWRGSTKSWSFIAHAHFTGASLLVVIWMRLEGMNRWIVSGLLDQCLVARIDPEACACLQLACACLSTSRAALAWSSTLLSFQKFNQLFVCDRLQPLSRILASFRLEYDSSQTEVLLQLVHFLRIRFDGFSASASARVT